MKPFVLPVMFKCGWKTCFMQIFWHSLVGNSRTLRHRSVQYVPNMAQYLKLVKGYNKYHEIPIQQMRLLFILNLYHDLHILIYILPLAEMIVLIIVLCAFYCLFVQVCVKGPLDQLDPAGAGSRRGKWGWGTSDYYWVTKPFSIIPSSSTPPPPFLVELYPSPAVSCLSRTAGYHLIFNQVSSCFFLKQLNLHSLMGLPNTSSLPLHVTYTQWSIL